MNKFPFMLGLAICVAPLLFPGVGAFAASENIINAPAAPVRNGYAPGALILLPDGRRTIIEEALPQGGWRTEEGTVILPDGKFENGGTAILVNPATMEPLYRPGMEIVLPDGRKTTIVEVLPNGDLRTREGLVLTPQGLTREKSPDVAKESGARTVPPAPPREDRAQKIPVPAVTAEAPKAEQKPGSTAESRLRLAEMIPLTRVPGKEGPAQPASKMKTPMENPAPEAKRTPGQPLAEAAKAQEKPMPEKKTPPERPAPKRPAQETPSRTAKTPVGQELKIPPEAIKTGSLDFLEGCWQGTRPEYHTKRTIKECFCFGPNGANGKRRIHDLTYGRTCIGATRANLSRNGVLSVSSEKAPCTDGERWGEAEMVCRNSGPRTPCSWVFRSANNGRQAYEIPFIRVESCGR